MAVAAVALVADFFLVVVVDCDGAALGVCGEAGGVVSVKDSVSARARAVVRRGRFIFAGFSVERFEATAIVEIEISFCLNPHP